MEPESAADYSRKSYWDARYQVEESYDWFPSVYQTCVQFVFDSIESVVYSSQESSPDTNVVTPATQRVIKVLHLGCGNSALCSDIIKLWRHKYRSGNSEVYSVLSFSIERATF